VTKFKVTTLAGGLMVTLLLATGMGISIARLSSTATEQLDVVRAHERQITLAERLRWNLELVVSIAKGYLITGDPTVLARLTRAQDEMQSILATLVTQAASTNERRILTELQKNATAFALAHQSLIADQTASTTDMLTRFEKNVLPLKNRVTVALDALAAHKEASITELYGQYSQDRDHLTALMYALLIVLVLAACAITALFSIYLSRAYRIERNAREAARKAMHAREELLGVVAHDLRNPLNAISMRATLVQRTTNPSLVNQQAQSIVNIATRMDVLISDMLDLATIEAGRFYVSAGPCEVAGILGKVQEVFAPICAAKQISLRCEMRAEGMWMQADQVRILRVFSNILGNAVKFSPSGAEISIEASKTGENVMFAIADQGPGIPADQQPQLFDRFWRPASSQTKGTGLGLFIAKGIVEAHRGRLWVTSSSNRGSTFYFCVPAADEMPTIESETSNHDNASDGL
jgi:signal transduction histidine kinase